LKKAFRAAEMFERHYTLVRLAMIGPPGKIPQYMDGQFGRTDLSEVLGYRFAQQLFAYHLAKSEPAMYVHCASAEI
jgi:hypothetical protein